MERVLITGGAGYIGSMLTGLLLDAGYAVTVFDRFLYGHKPLDAVADHPKLTVIEADIRDAPAVAAAVAGADCVLHLAAIVGYPACRANPHEAAAVNLGGTENLLRALQPDQRVLFASTLSVYGAVDGKAAEDTPARPLSLYGEHKARCEQMIRLHGEGHVILRFATLFGVSPRMRVDLLVNDFVLQALQKKRLVLYEGHFRRAFLHVTDAIAAYRFALAHYDQVAGGVFNVGNEDLNCTKLHVARRIREQVDFELVESDCGQDLDQRNYAVDCSRFNGLGYRAHMGLDEGITGLVRHLRDFQPDDTSRNN